MADEKSIQNVPDDDSKKDTVRINLPQGGAVKPAGSPTPTVRLKPSPIPGAVASDDESKKETAVMGMPVATPKPKKDTSRVQVPATKPGAPEMPRPTVKLKREEGTSQIAPAAPTAPTPAAAPAARPAAAAVSSVSGVDFGLAIAAMLVALAVAGYLFSLSNG
ncbi:MAG: hypothetical protein PCFJNLEI_02356 [Verrucomicrobiae bacterium]|nr:hypothetical protein [Verrucomicrobiae bacterium]